MYKSRNNYTLHIQQEFRVNPIVALLGPRQCGKTTLARNYLKDYDGFKSENYFDLERPSDLARLEHPELTLSKLTGLIIIDEIQRVPQLFTVLRTLVDDPQLTQQYLILGSASRELIKQSSESLAGRISYLELTPFNYNEVEEPMTLWLRGGFPRSYLAESEQLSFSWRENYIKTYLEQDIPNLGIQIPSAKLGRFWHMLAHYHANIFNASEIGRSLNITHNTARHYLDILHATFMVRQLQPWYENIKKRQVKSPKIYFRDTGIVHALLGITDMSALQLHPKLGASWEGFALEEIIRAHSVTASNCYFWAIHNSAELDLLLIEHDKRLGFEFKYTDAPTLTKSMKIAMDSLKLDQLTVIYPGYKNYPLDERIEVISLENYLKTCAT